jgi:outer membrane protein assembly factor BamE (lipoprotein component of BamABCDE complex)
VSGLRRLAVLPCALWLAACADPPPECTAWQSAGFSEEAFAEIAKGMPRAEVYERLGPGIRERSQVHNEMWFYGEPSEAARDPIPVIVFDDAAVVSVARTDRVTVGMDRASVEKALGKPQRYARGGRITLIDYTAPGSCTVWEPREVAIGPDDRVRWTWAGRIDRSYPDDPLAAEPAPAP